MVGESFETRPKLGEDGAKTVDEAGGVKKDVNILGYRPFKLADLARQKREMEKYKTIEKAELLMISLSNPPLEIKKTVSGEECIFKYSKLQYNGDDINIGGIIAKMKAEHSPTLKGIGVRFSLKSIGGERSLLLNITAPLSIMESKKYQAGQLSAGRYLGEELTRIYAGIADHRKKLREAQEATEAKEDQGFNTDKKAPEELETTLESGKRNILNSINQKNGNTYVLEGFKPSFTAIVAEVKTGGRLEVSTTDGVLWDAFIWDASSGIESQKGLQKRAVPDIQDFIKENYEG